MGDVFNAFSGLQSEGSILVRNFVKNDLISFRSRGSVILKVSPNVI